MLPSFGSFIVGSMLAPALVKRARPAYVMATGLAIAAVGLLYLTQVSAEAGLDVLVGASVVYSLGIAPIFTLTNDLILGAAPPERAGAASAISGDGRRTRRRALDRRPRHARHSRVPDADRRRHPGCCSGRFGRDGARHARRRWP